jgi:hypothetical protein
MPVVARVEAPTVGVDPLPNARVTATLDPNYNNRISQGLESIGGVAQKYAMDELEKASNAQYVDALTKSSQLETHLRDPSNPNGFYAPDTLGENWSNLHGKIMPQVQAGQEAILAGISNPNVKERLQAHFAQQATDIENSVMSTAVQRKDATDADVFKTGMAVQADEYTAKLASGDVGGAATARGNFDQIVDTFAAQHGMPAQASALIKRETLSASYRKVAENLIDTDANKAQAFLEKVAPEMTFTDTLAVNSRLRPILDAQIGSAAYDFHSGDTTIPVEKLPPSKDGAEFAQRIIGTVRQNETGGLGAAAATAVNPKATVSGEHATGTYQMEPSTAAAAWARMNPGVPFNPSVLKDRSPQGQATNAALASNELAHLWDLCAQAGVAPEKRDAAALAGYNMGQVAVQWALGKPYRTQSGALFVPKFPCDPEAMPAETRNYIAGHLTAPAGYGGTPSRGDVVSAIQADASLTPNQKRQALEKAAVVSRANNENRVDQERQDSTAIWGRINTAAQDHSMRGQTVEQILGPQLNAVAMTKDYYHSLQEHLKNPTQTDDPATVNFVQDLFHSATVSNDPKAIAAFVNYDITALSGKLKQETRQMFLDKQAEIAKGENGPAGMSSSKIVEDAKTQMFSPDDKSATTAQLRADFTTAYYKLESLARAKNGNHPLGVAEKQELVKSLQKTTAMEVWNSQRNTTISNPDGTKAGQISMDTAFTKGPDNNFHVPLYERMANSAAIAPETFDKGMQAPPAAQAQKVVPPADMQAIIKSFRARFGSDPTPEQIRWGYEHGGGK